MKKLFLYLLLNITSFSVIAQAPRTALTGSGIDGTHDGQAIAVSITPNPQIWLSDEIVPDKQLKWKSWIPVTVWRQRKVAGEYRTCPVITFQFEFVPSTLAQDLRPQLFVIPADLVREFDNFDFEYRSWYSISTSLDAGLETIPASPDTKLYPPNFLTARFGPWNCSESPRPVQHIRLFKE